MAGQSTEKNGQSTQRGYLMLLVGHERATSDAALGIALRAAGHNLRVHIIEFLKGGRDRGEVAAVSFLTGVTLTQYGTVLPSERWRTWTVRPSRLTASRRRYERRRCTCASASPTSSSSTGC